LNCENCTGNDIKNSKNTNYSFNALNCEDCKYLYDVLDAKDCQDLNYSLYKPELSYELISTLNMVKSAFCMASHYNNEVYYSDTLNHCNNCFGCSALTHKEYCILNKQYSREEYEELVQQIIEHMQKTGEWGEFFPSSISPHPYEDTVANEYFPMSAKKNEVVAVESDYKIPDNIVDVKDDIVGKVLIDEKCGKAYKIIEQELRFYRKNHIPVPRRSPDQRHFDRIVLRTPRRLFARKCDKCGVDLQSPYKDGAKEKVYCDKCYLVVIK